MPRLHRRRLWSATAALPPLPLPCFYAREEGPDDEEGEEDGEEDAEGEDEGGGVHGFS